MLVNKFVYSSLQVCLIIILGQGFSTRALDTSLLWEIVMQQRIFSSIPGFYPQNASSTPHPTLGMITKTSSDIATCPPQGQNHPS